MNTHPTAGYLWPLEEPEVDVLLIAEELANAEAEEGSDEYFDCLEYYLGLTLPDLISLYRFRMA